jgi:4-amino-4-deoxy-L-arabinose transferase-like glycosyltransferase
MSIEPDRSIFRNVDPVTQAKLLKIFVLAGLLLIHINFSLFLLAPGHLSIDEAVYHLMARSFVHSGDLGIWNGYQEFPSPELLLPLFQVHGGETFPPYPSLFPILAAPFYWLAGYHGLFLFNALAFVGVVWLCYATARAIFNDTDLALNASLILVLASYAWEYSQAAWPHAASTLFVLGAAYCAVRAHKTMNDRVSLAWALAAGLAAGLGTGVRLDTVFVVPALVIPFLFVSPWRPLRALVVCLGAIPGLALISALNYFKFGVLSPFSYGVAGGGATSGLGPYLTIAVVGLVLTTALWCATRLGNRGFLRAHRWSLTAALILLCSAFIVIPQVWELISRIAIGAYQLLVDLRIRDLDIVEGGLSRSPGGGMIYIQGLKKSLLQNCPYLVVLALPFADLLRGNNARFLAVLFLVPAAFVAVYSFFAWHGGQALNMRYFVPTLPFLAVLTACAWRRLPKNIGQPWILVCMAVVFAVQFIATVPRPASAAVQEIVYLTLPLVLALLLGLFMLIWSVRGGDGAPGFVRGGLVATTVAALTWAGLVAFGYDLPRSYFVRKGRADFVKSIERHVQPDSLLFTDATDQFFGLIDHGRVRFASPLRDGYQSFSSLAEFHLDAGRPVYLWLVPETNREIDKRGLLAPYAVMTLFSNDNGRLVELR